jgi:hypothetical protein
MRNDWSQHWNIVEEFCSYFFLLYYVFTLVPREVTGDSSQKELLLRLFPFLFLLLFLS